VRELACFDPNHECADLADDSPAGGAAAQHHLKATGLFTAFGAVLAHGFGRRTGNMSKIKYLFATMTT
jgi:hypothetical protein